MSIPTRATVTFFEVVSVQLAGHSLPRCRQPINKQVSRTARAAVRAKANELLLGRTERGEVIGNVGATTGED